jgi:hypothetical protein
LPQPRPTCLLFRSLQALFLLAALSAAHFGWGRDLWNQDAAAFQLALAETGENLGDDPADPWDDGNAGPDPSLATGASSLRDAMPASLMGRSGASTTWPTWQPGGTRATGPPRA